MVLGKFSRSPWLRGFVVGKLVEADLAIRHVALAAWRVDSRRATRSVRR